MCLLFFAPLFLRLIAAAAVGGLGPVELPFQILFLGDLAIPELFLAELPLLQEIVQQAIPEADRHVLFREIRVGGVCDLIEPGAGVVLVQLEQGVHHIFCCVQGRFIEGTVVHVQYLRNLAEQLFLGRASVAFVLCDTDVCALLLEPDGKAYSPTYLKTLHGQLSAILNHAVRFYGLKSNAAATAGCMGSEKHKEMLFWTKEEYLKFAEAMMDKPQSYYAFEVLYWCGIREGELLALTPADFDLDKGLLSITKSYQRLKGRDVITDPKTPKSVRVIQMPQFLTDEIRDYLKSLYKVRPDQRIFEVTKSYLHHEMDRGAKEAGVKRIRIHDLRHSHVSLLIEMGFSALAIADRVGHESVDITYKYAHLFPSKQQEMAQKLDMERKEG